MFWMERDFHIASGDVGELDLDVRFQVVRVPQISGLGVFSLMDGGAKVVRAVIIPRVMLMQVLVCKSNTALGRAIVTIALNMTGDGNLVLSLL